ncbi:zinc finger MYM-type protein 1-like [Triplophysa dalaica]|uniref:zinc finger MYM-type protein 1-like n=1 Tax=Triplophysa dalaica TaxID=1582913 RepID=UPI0024DF640A|nr:zinc finger MYM-type protein 1-like [Triplophysa dalaica]
MMKFLEEFDPFLQSYTPPAHSTYLSSGSQNEMIQCCAEEVTASIIKEMKHSKMYAVMADEARDGHVEQLAVCVRYVGYENTVKESFLELTSLKSFDAHSITEAIEEVLKSKGLEDLQCVAQAYDGASVMSGAVRGVQAQFRVKHPEAVYVHCYAHELNLVLCHTCRAVPEAIDFFDTLESVYCFFSVSLVNHQSFSDMQKALGLEKSELVQLSKTRWACQLKSVTAVIANLPALLKSLTELTSTTTAIGLLSKLSRLSNVYMLVMFKALLSTTEGLHKYLQKEDVDLAQATWYKDAVLETLRSMRTEEMAEKFYNQAKEILEANHLSETPAPGGSQKRKQKRLDDYVVESTTGTRAYVSTLDKIRNHIFYPCLDRMVSELEGRFCGVGAELMQGIKACHPAANDFLCEESLELIAKHYNMKVSKEEVAVARQFLFKRRDEGVISDMASVYKLLDPDMFPSLRSVFQAALTIPVSSCSCERSFSALRRLHTWLRRTMGQQRLNYLAVMSIERGLVCVTDHNSVMNRFAMLKPRKYPLMIPSKASEKASDERKTTAGDEKD